MKKVFLNIFLLATTVSVLHAQVPAKGEVWLAPACKPKLYGLNDASGGMLLKPQYKFLSAQEDNAWIAEKGSLYGVIDSKGDWKIKPEFIGIYQYLGGKAVAAKKVPSPRKNYGDYYDYDYSYSYQDSTILYGVIDESGVWLIEPKYNMLQLCEDGSVLYTDDQGKFGFLNLDGSVMIGARYLWASRMNNGLAIVAEEGVQQPSIYNAYTYSYYYNHNQFPGEYYLIDKSGTKLNADPYQVIRQYFSNRAAFNKDGIWKKERYSQQEKLLGGKWGYLDETGKVIIPAIYDYVYDFINTVSGPRAKVREGTKVKWIDVNGDETGPADEVTSTSPVVYCEPGSFGYLDLNGNWAIQPQFKVANVFSEGMAAAMKMHAVDQECDEDNNSEYDYYGNYNYNYSYNDGSFNPLNIFKNGIPVKSEDPDENALRAQDSVKRAEAQKRRLYGYIDAKGNMILEAKYEYALQFHEGRAYVKFRGLWGVIDKLGNWIMPPVMETPDGLYGGDQYYGDGGYSRYYDPYNYGSYNQVDYASEIDYANSAEYYMKFSQGMGPFFKYSKWGYMDSTGKVIVSPVYETAGIFSNGLAAVSNNEKYGYIDLSGKEIIPLRFNWAGTFTADGMAIAGVYPNKEDMGPPPDGTEYEDAEQSYYGFLGKNGKWLLTPRFTTLSDFSEGLAVAAMDNGNAGYINKTGTFVISQKYSYAYDFNNGFALVKMSMAKPMYIDKSGKINKTYTEDNPPPRKDEFILITADLDENYGGKDLKGNVVIPFEYEYIGTFTKVS